MFYLACMPESERVYVISHYKPIEQRIICAWADNILLKISFFKYTKLYIDFYIAPHIFQKLADLDELRRLHRCERKRNFCFFFPFNFFDYAVAVGVFKIGFFENGARAVK